MKTKVISEVKSTEIDWSKANLVKNSTGLVVLTTGKHSNGDFSGTVLVSHGGNYIGAVSDRWGKHDFTLITEPFTIEFNSK